MIPRTPIFLLAAVLLAGCSNAPDTYAPPVQRRPSYVPPESGSIGYFVAMSDPGANAYIVQDIENTSQPGGWRWAFRHPQLRFFLPKTAGLKFSMDYTIPERIFREMGPPVTLSLSINGKPFDRIRLEKGGHLEYRKAVPPELLLAGRANLVSIEPDKVWIAPADGAVFGFILSRVGFTE